MLPLYKKGRFAKQRWQWKYHGGRLCRVCPAGYLHTAVFHRQTRMDMGGYADQTRNSDFEFIQRLMKAGLSFGPGKLFHAPTFIQRYDSGRAHVSDSGVGDETDDERHARIDREIASRGVTGTIEIVPRWLALYQNLADQSLEAVKKTGWGND
jgi:hypothetical protein